MHAAVRGGDEEVLRMLVGKEGILLDSIDEKTGVTALHCCAEYNNFRLAEILLQAGASPNENSNRRQETPLHFAIHHGNEDVVRLLLHYGAVSSSNW